MVVTKLLASNSEPQYPVRSMCPSVKGRPECRCKMFVDDANGEKLFREKQQTKDAPEHHLQIRSLLFPGTLVNRQYLQPTKSRGHQPLLPLRLPSAASSIRLDASSAADAARRCKASRSGVAIT